MRCLIWAAVSTKPQADDKDSIPTQIEAARELVAREGWQEVHEPLVIPGHSRSYLFLHDIAENVPEYRQLMGLARSGSIDVVVCRSRDRLGRTDALIAQLEGYLRAHHCQVYSLEMPTPLVDPEHLRTDRAGIWSAAVERARAEDELAQLRARHSFGMKARIRKGYHANRIPYGYRRGPEGVGEVYEPEAAVVQLMYRWLLQGATLTDIRRKLPNHATERYPQNLTVIRYVLENPYYAGVVTWSRLETASRCKERNQWVEADGLHEPIIERDVWEAVQRELQRRSDANMPRTSYALTGLTYCGYCGEAMRGKVSGVGDRRYRYYVCARDGCERNSYRADVLESHMADWIRTMDEDPGALEYEIQKAMEKANALQADEIGQMGATLNQRRTSLERWTTDYELGLLSREEYYGHQARLKDEIGRLETAIARATREQREPERAAEVMETLAEQADWTDRETANLVRTQLATIGVRIIVADKHPTFSLSA